MTAKQAGSFAWARFWTTIKRLRDQWVLVVFLATTLFWGRDIYEQFIRLPAQVEDLQGTVVELNAEVARLDGARANGFGPALVFPGANHGVGDGRPGAFVTVTLAPAKRVRKECRTIAFRGFMLDNDGNWFSVPTDLAVLPDFEGTLDLSFAARIHPRMRPGRAQFVGQIDQDCGTWRRIDKTPLLQFRVLPDQND